MSTSPMMSSKREELFDKRKVKKKMSKAQIQLAIVKKKQCDAKALTIVEQLLEPNVNPQWLLSNLGYINKSHMEDVIEERAIVKLCGYVLCDNALTVVIKQQYHISTKKNKVYDVSRRKNFCSSRCYGACNYLLEQMLTSPLWLREKEEIPAFRFLPAKEVLERSVPGEEIHVRGSDPVANADNESSENLKEDENEEEDECEEEKAEMKNKPSAHPIFEQNLAAKQDPKEGDDDLNNDVRKPNSDGEKDDDSSLRENAVDPKASKSKKRVTFGDTLERTFSTADAVQLRYAEVQDVKELSKPDSLIEEDILDEDDLDPTKADDNDACDNKETETSISSDTTLKRKKEKNKRNKSKKDLQGDSNKSDTCEFYTLAMRIEKNVREWFTEDTVCLLSGEENTKSRLLENVTQHDRYLQLCKKLNKLQLEDDKDDKTNLVKGNLKPLPHLSVLQEEGKKMELKVRAFFQGKTVIENPEAVQNNDAVDDESAAVLPLTDAHAPKALRRRIFLDKLHKILPDLLRALASNRPQLLAEYAYGTEKSALIKALVNTFALSAKNIIFKTTEWTLVGLIFIKMLSILDPQMKTLLTTKQARIYISMILMSYKLDPNYLDRLVIELTNNPKIFTANSDENTL